MDPRTKIVAVAIVFWALIGVLALWNRRSSRRENPDREAEEIADHLERCTLDEASSAKVLMRLKRVAFRYGIKYEDLERRIDMMWGLRHAVNQRNHLTDKRLINPLIIKGVLEYDDRRQLRITGLGVHVLRILESRYPTKSILVREDSE